MECVLTTLHSACSYGVGILKNLDNVCAGIHHFNGGSIVNLLDPQVAYFGKDE